MPWGRRFFEGASVTVPTGAKVGLVGRNGNACKLTLFKIILGELSHDRRRYPSCLKAIASPTVDQEAAASPVSLLDTVLAADWERERTACLKELEIRPARAGWRHPRPPDRDRR